MISFTAQQHNSTKFLLGYKKSCRILSVKIESTVFIVEKGGTENEL